jgi:hypothetical protein
VAEITSGQILEDHEECVRNIISKLGQAYQMVILLLLDGAM